MSEPEKQETRVHFDVPPGYSEDARTDVYLSRHLANASRAKVQRGIKEGRVSINGVVVTKASHRVQAGDRIDCIILRPPPMEIVPEAIPLDIRFEDAHVIVLDKPAGMVVHPAYGNRTGTLVHALLHHVGAGSIILESDDDDPETTTDDDPDDAGPEGVPGLSSVNVKRRFKGDTAVRPGIVHRLDKDTSGLMIVAKNDEAHRRLARQFMDRTIRRRYEAIVWGRPSTPEGRIETHIGRDRRDRKKMAVVPTARGKLAITNYRLLEQLTWTARMEFRLETGRTHQIRVHARHIGHPVLADATYGGERIMAGPDTARRRATLKNLFETLPRQALHARTLGFRHPASGEQMEFESELPADMKAALERLHRTDSAFHALTDS